VKPTALVSVIVPLHDQGDVVGETLESILAQQDCRFDLLVVDDGSCDGGGEVASRFVPRVRVIRQPRMGAAAARNRGLAETVGDLVVFFDADDLMPAGRLAQQMTALGRDPGLDGVFGDVLEFRAGPAPWRGEPRPGRLPGSLMIRRSALERVGGFREGAAPVEAVEWAARAQDAGLNIAHLPGVGPQGHPRSPSSRWFSHRMRYDPASERLDRVLLGAAVAPDLPGHPVAQAWAAVAAQLRLPGSADHFAGERQDLIGLLHRTARAAEAHGELAARLAGGHRRLWVSNQLRLAEIRTALDALKRDGVRHLVTGDLAMISWLGDLGARPLRRAGVMVAVADRDRAIAALQEAGWRAQLRPSGVFVGDRHITELQNLEGNRLELACAETLGVGGKSALLSGDLVLRRPDRGVLLTTLIEDPRGWLPRFKLLRLTDVALLAAGATPEEWQVVLARLRDRHQVSAAAARLRGLAMLVPGAVPDAVDASLMTWPTRSADRWAHRLDLAAPSLARHLRDSAGVRPWQVARTLPASLRLSWHLSSSWQVPLTAAGRVAERTIWSRRGGLGR
jgi:hypothetical protein